MIERREEGFVWSIEVPGHEGGCFGAVVCPDDRGLNESTFMDHRGEVVMVELLNKQHALRLLYAPAPVDTTASADNCHFVAVRNPLPLAHGFFRADVDITGMRSLRHALDAVSQGDP